MQPLAAHVEKLERQEWLQHFPQIHYVEQGKRPKTRRLISKSGLIWLRTTDASEDEAELLCAYFASSDPLCCALFGCIVGSVVLTITL